MLRIDDDLAFMLKFENVAWYEKGQVKILDRRIYPRKIEFVICNNHKEVANAIRDMVTQSAGPYTAAGMGMALAAFECRDMDNIKKIDYLEKAAKDIYSARPTTKDRMIEVTEGCLEIAKNNINSKNLDNIISNYTIKTMENRYERIGKVAKYLVKMFPDNGKILTQCYGETIIGMMLKECKKQNKNIELYCAETRPFLQGARFTASVACDMGFKVTVITDNMIAATIKNKKIDLFTSAADSITRDGYVVNKVGTSQMAIVSKYYEIPYFVTGIPDSVESINNIKIEERDPKKVLECNGIKNTLDGVKGYYPAFDITPPHLISGVVTDTGIYSPYDLENYKSSDGSFYSFAV
ncbi:s-methyl-5-thioribose-1-phosphate isomerase [Peptoniphilus stercorisuis]|uniref:Methylthioribose-1-phosphate isomerase n=1 Tax=Peptoniphilus stercorisuis TaxID=1436965 RepID=A0ABS4KCY0_9FIRM|nr:s-methyl-5-thioribose-1-phosphate isomerase [Peptoniphilus stercorisuis]MBP2025215.1 methylthioribose-1-phosphate isomerase [Peptoniphilus stercorisuis]